MELAIEEELKPSGSLLGYRLMQHRLRCLYEIRTSRETVKEILSVLDPKGVQSRIPHMLRRRRYWSMGPNSIRHIDGNNKLVPYGLV